MYDHTLKAFIIIIIIIKTSFYLFYLLKINKGTNKKYLGNSNLVTHFY